jgi:extracellular matrix protein 14
MRQSTFAVLSLLLLGPSLIAAAPRVESYNPDYSLHLHTDTSRSWQQRVDALLRRIWGSQEKQNRLGGDGDDTDASSDPLAPKLLAAYGDDMVLRFNISTTEEASALAEAANNLFLDVWEFNEDWVDIRISKQVVSLDTMASC